MFSSLDMLLTVTSLGMVITGLARGILITTSSSGPGTTPPCQFLGSFQLLSVLEIHLTFATSALSNWFTLVFAASKDFLTAFLFLLIV